MSEEVPMISAEDESAADAIINADLEKLKAGQTPEPQAPSQTVATNPTGPTGDASPTGEVDPTGETGATGADNGGPQPTGATGEEDPFRIPNKGKYESDAAYEKRVELLDLARRRRAATTPEAKAEITKEIKKVKGDLFQLGSSETLNNDGAPSGEIDPALAADQERLRAAGGATKEDVDARVQNALHTQQVRSDLNNFIGNHSQLKDEDMREVFFAFVEGNYAWQGKSGKELNTVLELAYENMFRQSESVQERVIKGADVAAKVNTMQFPGGTGSKTTFSPEKQKSIDELKATGMSEDKAIELLSE